MRKIVFPTFFSLQLLFPILSVITNTSTSSACFFFFFCLCISAVLWTASWFGALHPTEVWSHLWVTKPSGKRRSHRGILFGSEKEKNLFQNIRQGRESGKVERRFALWRNPWEGETSLNLPIFPSLSDVLRRSVWMTRMCGLFATFEIQYVSPIYQLQDNVASDSVTLDMAGIWSWCIFFWLRLYIAQSPSLKKISHTPNPTKAQAGSENSNITACPVMISATASYPVLSSSAATS